VERYGASRLIALEIDRAANVKASNFYRYVRRNIDLIDLAAKARVPSLSFDEASSPGLLFVDQE
jgi:hypothetical protein